MGNQLQMSGQLTQYFASWPSTYPPQSRIPSCLSSRTIAFVFITKISLSGLRALFRARLAWLPPDVHVEIRFAMARRAQTTSWMGIGAAIS